jgi:hypothetical protein
VPVLQRGLVWNPAQIELLWDSILRGFPIGALVLSARIEEQEKEADQQRGFNHHLLDGQQRCDAIALGYKDPFRETETDADKKKRESILWLDLNPDGDAWNTREFLVRLTTPSHPWGYAKNDSAGNLGANAIRDSLNTIGIDPAIEGYERPSAVALSPYVAVAPVPLSWLFSAQSEDQSGFWAAIKTRLDRLALQPWHQPLRAFLSNEEGAAQRTKIFEAIRRTELTTIIALCAPSDLLVNSRQESASSPERGNIASIEHLFQRLNQQGTPLDGEELAYSMIKANWPQLAGPIDQIAQQLPATRLITLGIRAALAVGECERLPRGLTVSGIRSLARKNDAKTERIYRYIKEDLGRGCQQIETWLRYNPKHNQSGLLPVHIGSIAQGSPDVFLLLLTFANRPESDWVQDGTDWPKCFQALATAIHWFGRKKEDITNRVFHKCALQISFQNIKNALAEAITEGDLRPLHSPDAVEGFLNVPKEDLLTWDWDQLRDQGNGTEEAKRALWGRWEEFLWFRGQRELLLYAQRDYIDRRFSDYDPARKDFWKGHNRPWDFDHLLAAKYLHYCRGPYKPVCDKWVWTIGNLRAWPFEDNRSDQAQTAENKLSGVSGDAKRIDSFLKEGEVHGFSVGETLGGDAPDDAYAFVSTCRSRLLRIYRTWYESVGVADLIIPDEKMSDLSAAVLPANDLQSLTA